MAVLRIVYLFVSVWLALYGFNSFVLVALYLRHKGAVLRTEDDDRSAQFPPVTVQLPVYNERHVVERAIDSLVRLDWPREQLHIQVLDDSTDETTAIARQCVESYREQGIKIELLHRRERTGFKAGALNAALESASGEFVAIFDADFRPEPDFLHQTVPYLRNPELGFVQTRWGHLNDEYSLLTQAQAMALDGHFVIEHVARQRAGLLTNFSGTGGIWRRRCIEACGGWHPEMLTEDMELSYRAQLDGWKGLMLNNVVSPAELPVQLAAFKRQQFRWAKGNTQCLIRLAPVLLRAPLPLFSRLQGLVHLSYYLAHPLMLVVMLCTLPLMWFGLMDGWSLACLSLATLGPPLLYTLGQKAIYPDWARRLRALPILICLGTGMALNSTAAIIEALIGIESPFLRTPKFQIENRGTRWEDYGYALSKNRLIIGEGLLAVYALLTTLAAIVTGHIQALPFILLYVVGFGYVTALTLVQDRRKVAARKRLLQKQSLTSLKR